MPVLRSEFLGLETHLITTAIKDNYDQLIAFKHFVFIYINGYIITHFWTPQTSKQVKKKEEKDKVKYKAFGCYYFHFIFYITVTAARNKYNNTVTSMKQR